ncbi:hypothetical protein Tco_1031379 [Tanacetum coccineum]|uniref:Uncharacterized protein n=1 Tax=Tanacetum coccineum TaxID=301880 RepID=A0ABQ5G9X9_9ASTR
MGDEHLDTIPSIEEPCPNPNDDDDDFEDHRVYVFLREKLVEYSVVLITNIESLKDNPTPDRVLKSPSLVPISVTDSNSFFEESDTSLSHLDNSLPEFESFRDHKEETRSGSTTTHANNSFPEYDSFLFEIEPDQGGLTSVNSNDPLLELPEFESFHFDSSFPRPPPEPPDVEISLIIKTDAPVINNFDEHECFDPGGYEIDVEDDDSFTFVIRTFLHLEPVASHRDGTFICFNVYPNINESPIEIFYSIFFPMDNLIRGRDTRILKTLVLMVLSIYSSFISSASFNEFDILILSIIVYL